MRTYFAPKPLIRDSVSLPAILPNHLAQPYNVSHPYYLMNPTLKMPSLGVTQAEMEELVRGVVKNADLSQMTGKVVRERVLVLLGDRAGDDPRALKRSVRDALKVVLSAVNSPSKSTSTSAPAAETKPSPNNKKQAKEHENPPKEKKSGNGKKAPAAEEDEPIVKRAGSKRRLRKLAESSDEDGMDENFEPDNELDYEPDDEPASKPASKPAAKLAAKPVRGTGNAGEEDGDVTDDIPAKKGRDPPAESPEPDSSDHDADDEYFSEERAPRGRPKQKRQRAPRAPSADSSAEDAPRPQNGREGPSVQRSPRKRVRRSKFRTANDLSKLMKLCGRLGCRGARFKASGSTVEEKCTSLVSFLNSKGIIDVGSLNAKDIEAHRARLENESEVAGLDSRFVSLFIQSISISWLAFRKTSYPVSNTILLFNFLS